MDNTDTNTINLDIVTAEFGRQLANIKDVDEKMLNAALTVLEEQGPYATFLYIRARYQKIALRFEEPCISLLGKVFGKKVDNTASALDAVKILAENLDDLLFARDLLRNTFTYARYYIKAKEGSQ